MVRFKKIFKEVSFMREKQYSMPELTVSTFCSEDVVTASEGGTTLGKGEKGVWDNEIFG